MRSMDWDAMGEVWAERLGGDPRDDGNALAELMRTELIARGTVRRASLIAAIGALLGEARDAHTERVTELLERLEQIGDAVAGRAGLVAAAPLRIVRRGGGRYLVIGTQPTRELERVLNVRGFSAGVPRAIALPAPEAETFERAVAAIGAVLTADEWARLHRAAHGREWLEILEDSDDDPPESAVPVDWSQRQVYLANASEPVEARRWVRDPDAKLAGLVRVWRPDRRPTFGWVRTAGTASIRRLTREEGLRTRFALDLTQNVGTTLQALHDACGVSFACGVWLPSAEYRYLACVADAIERSASGISVRCSHDAWPTVVRVLNERLGLRFASSEGPRDGGQAPSSSAA